MAIDKNNVLTASWNNESLLLVRTALQELLTALGDSIEAAEGGNPASINMSVEGTMLTATVTLADETELSKSINLATMGFLTQHQSLKTINGKSVVGSGDVDVVHPVVIYNTAPMQFDDTLPIGTVYFDGALHRMTATTPESLGVPRKDVIYFSQQDSAFFRWNDAWVKVMEMPDISALTNLINSKANAADVVNGIRAYGSSTNLPKSNDGVVTLPAIQEPLQYDEQPTQNSTKMVKSGGIYTALQALLSNISIGQNGNWYIGQTDTTVKAQGPKGNSVADGDTFEIVNNLHDGGEADALSAEQGKVLKGLIDDLALEVAQKADGVSVSFSQGVTNIIIGGGGSSVETTAAPSISVANSGLNKVVTINNDEDETGATIYYTLDGSEPTVQSEVYSSPITISEAGTTTVKAIAKASGKLASSAVSQSVYIEENDWTDGVRFTRNTYGGTTNATGYSISPFIPVNDSDLIWLWCGILLADSTNPYAFLIQYDENKDYIGQFFSVNYDWKYPLNSGTKYIRFVTKTEDKQKCFVYKYTNDVAGDATGVFLFKGNKIDAATYGNMCGFTYSDTNGNISRAARPTTDANWTDPPAHKVVTGLFDVSKYSSIDIKHGFGGTYEFASTQIVRFYDSSGQSASGKYYTLTDDRPDPRVGMSLATLGNYTNARFQINGLKLHSCYAIGHWTDENNVEHEEYIWKGCDVVPEEEENVE